MKKTVFLAFIAGLFIMVSCNKDEGTTALVVRLTDSPGDYEKVNIDLESVQVHVNSEADDQDGSRWTQIPAFTTYLS